MLKHLTTGILAFVPMMLSAQDATEPGINGSYGLALVGGTPLYEGENAELLPAPFLAINWGRWTVNTAKGIEYTALDSDTSTLSFGLLANNLDAMPDTALFDGLNREIAIELAIYTGYDFGSFDIAAQLSHDISSVHGGYSAEVSVGTAILLGPVIVEGRLGARYLDANLGAYQFGVKESQATDLRTVYDLEDSWSPTIDLSMMYALNDKTMLGGFARQEFISDEIADSPLVGSSDQTSFGLFLTRSF